MFQGVENTYPQKKTKIAVGETIHFRVVSGILKITNKNTKGKAYVQFNQIST